MKNKFGFTIVEVLVVIGVIALLTVIIFPAVNEIRAKNRDAERVSDIAAIQLGLSLYYSHKGVYPNSITDPNLNLVPKYFPSDSLISPSGDAEYIYVPLARTARSDKCIYYHLGVELELPNAQIDQKDVFSSSDENNITNGYSWCDGVTAGIDPDIENMYHVRPN